MPHFKRLGKGKTIQQFTFNTVNNGNLSKLDNRLTLTDHWVVLVQASKLICTSRSAHHVIGVFHLEKSMENGIELMENR